MRRKEAKVLFERATRLRDGGDLDDAKAAFLECLSITDSADRGFQSAIYGQLAYIEDLLSENTSGSAKTTHLRAVVENSRKATSLAPRAELPSLQLYISLVELGAFKEALEEAIRFLTIKDSAEYRAMLARHHAEEGDPEIARLAESVRRLLLTPDDDRPGE